jgi:hypothetical protein
MESSTAHNLEYNLEKVPQYVYENRRRVVAAVFLAVIATFSNAFSKNGTGWPLMPTFGFFLIMTVGPLAIGKLLNIMGERNV